VALRTYLGHCGDLVTSFLKEAGAQRVLFIPWALKDWDKYFANPSTIEYDATGQPKDHTGRPQVGLATAPPGRKAAGAQRRTRRACARSARVGRVRRVRAALQIRGPEAVAAACPFSLPQGRLKELGFDSSSIHHTDDPIKAVKEAQARRPRAQRPPHRRSPQLQSRRRCLWAAATASGC